MNDIERSVPKLVHQSEIGVMLFEKGDLLAIVAEQIKLGLRANRLNADRAAGFSRRKDRYFVPAIAKLGCQHVRVHLKPACKGLGNRIFQVSNDTDTQFKRSFLLPSANVPRKGKFLIGVVDQMI